MLATTVVDARVLGATVLGGALGDVDGDAATAIARSAAVRPGVVSSAREPGAKRSPSQARPAAIDPSRTACVAFSTYRESASLARGA
jgi:hypothetical protein